MNDAHRQRLMQVCAALIHEGGEVAATKFSTGSFTPAGVSAQPFHRWWAKVRSFAHQMGTAAQPWRDILSTASVSNTYHFTLQMLGTLEAIQHELDNNHLDSFTQLVRAETLADLLDQADHLLEAGYHLAAGVLGRAVLEEHLRVTCAAVGCVPAKGRPTINDYNQALYAAEHYSKTRMKHLEALASIGNDAAHNLPELEVNDVRRLLADLPGVIEETRA